MGKDDQMIMAIPRDVLFGDDYFEGFRPHSEVDYESRILEYHFFGRRGNLEEDPTHKQPIPYCLIINPELKQIFAYQRAGKDYDEARLRGKWSWGIGGHIEETDTEDENPIHASMSREALQEEVDIQGSVSPRVLGYLNEEDDVGRVHFGILYILETDATVVIPKDPEIAHGELTSVQDLELICARYENKVEGWSRFALEALGFYKPQLGFSTFGLTRDVF